MSSIFVAKVLGENFMSIIEQPLDLANIVDSEVGTGSIWFYILKMFIATPYLILLKYLKAFIIHKNLWSG